MKNTSSSVQLKVNNKRKSSRVQRACYNCRKRKQGCDEERPCKRCADKGVECVEVETKKRMRRSHNISHSHTHREDEEDCLWESGSSHSDDSMETITSEDSSSIDTSLHSIPTVNPSKQNSPQVQLPVPHKLSPISSKENIGIVGSPITKVKTIASSGHHKNHKEKEDKKEELKEKKKYKVKKREKVSQNLVPSHPTFESPFPLETVTPEQMRQRLQSSVPSLSGKPIPITPALIPQFTSSSSPSLTSQPSKNTEFIIQGESNHQHHQQQQKIVQPQPQQLLLPPSFHHHHHQHSPSFSLLPHSTITNEYELMPMYTFPFEVPSTAINHHHHHSSVNGMQSSLSSKLSLGMLLPFLGSSLGSNLSQSNWDDSGALTGDYDLDFPFYVSPPTSPRMGDLLEDDNMLDDDPFLEQFISGFDRAEFNAEFNKAKQLWKEIMGNLRTLDWQKVQTSLQEMDSMQHSSRKGGEGSAPSASPAMLFWSPGGRIHHANDSFCHLVGYSVDELRVSAHHTFQTPDQVVAHALFHPEEMVKILKKQLDAMQNPDSSNYRMKTRLINKWRQEIPVSCSISNLRDTMGMPLLTSMIIHS